MALPIKVHDNRGEDAEDRYTAHVWLREDVSCVSVIEVDLETYGPSEDVARQRMGAVMARLAAKLLGET